MTMVGAHGATSALAATLKAGADSGAMFAKAVVASVESDGTLTAYVSGSDAQTAGIRYMGHVHPVAGQHVWVLQQNGVWLAFGVGAPAPVLSAWVRRTNDTTITDASVGGNQVVSMTASSGTWTADDPCGMFTTFSPTRLTAPIGGVYAAACGVEYAANANGYRQVGVKMNGTLRAVNRGWNNAGSPWIGNASMTGLVMTAGQYIEIDCRQTSGSTLTLNAASWSLWMSLTYIGPAGS